MKRKEYKYVLEHLIYLLLGKADFVEIHLEFVKKHFELLRIENLRIEIFRIENLKFVKNPNTFWNFRNLMLRKEKEVIIGIQYLYGYFDEITI